MTELTAVEVINVVIDMQSESGEREALCLIIANPIIEISGNIVKRLREVEQIHLNIKNEGTNTTTCNAIAN